MLLHKYFKFRSFKTSPNFLIKLSKVNQPTSLLQSYCFDFAWNSTNINKQKEILEAFTQRQLKTIHHTHHPLKSYLIFYSASISAIRISHDGKCGQWKKEHGFFVCYWVKEGRWVQAEAISVFAWQQHLPWGCPPFWSSARRLQWLWSHIWRWLPFWALLSAQQPEAGGRESSLLKQPSTLGSASPLVWDWLLHSGTHNATLNQKTDDWEKWPGLKAAPPCQ